MIFVGLNRLGLVVNFIAGFMIAPELVGIERLKRLEAWLERLLSSAKDRLTRSENRLRNLSMKITERFFASGCILLPLLFLLTCIYSTFWWFGAQTPILAGSVIVGAYLLLMSFGSNEFIRRAPDYQAYHGNGAPQPLAGQLYEQEQKKYEEYIRRTSTLRGRVVQVFSILILGPVSAFAVILQGTALLLISLLVLPLLYLIKLILSLGFRILSTITRNLEGDDRLRAILVSWGIVFYILGNMLQLIATF